MLVLDPLGDPTGCVLGGEVGDEDGRAAQFLREPTQPLLPRATRIRAVSDSRASLRAVASPMPLDAPVTRATTRSP